VVPRSYAPEFRRRVVELVRLGRPVSVVASEVGVSEATVYRWREQDRVDRGDRPGLSSVERVELAEAGRRIRQLETELEITRRRPCCSRRARCAQEEVPGDRCSGRAGLRR
jgi:transposase-like protein